MEIYCPENGIRHLWWKREGGWGVMWRCGLEEWCGRVVMSCVCKSGRKYFPLKSTRFLLKSTHFPFDRGKYFLLTFIFRRTKHWKM